MGRHSEYTEEQAAEICERISNGEPLRQICRDDHMPAWNTVYKWLNRNDDFQKRFALARERGFDAIAEDTIAMVDEKPERCDTQFGDKVDAGYVQWQKNRVEQRLKLLAKWSPKRYGDRQAVDLSGGLSLSDKSDDDIRAELAALTAAGALPTTPPADDDCSDLY